MAIPAIRLLDFGSVVNHQSPLTEVCKFSLLSYYYL